MKEACFNIPDYFTPESYPGYGIAFIVILISRFKFQFKGLFENKKRIESQFSARSLRSKCDIGDSKLIPLPNKRENRISLMI